MDDSKKSKIKEKIMKWLGNKKFAFTIVDDTDMSTVSNVKPVYELLYNLGIKTTKTVWVYPPRDNFKGECLLDNDYKSFILWLCNNGFEIGFHGAGTGKFTRNETLKALEIFKEIIGYYPRLHVNHANNPDGIYWGYKRFSFPFKILYKLFFSNGVEYSGEKENSIYFWGDICKQNVKYIRNRVYSGINTLRYDPYMPYLEKKKEAYSNFWFSSSDGFNVNTFCNLIKKENIDRLSYEGGCSIVYTHFGNGFVDNEGTISQKFKESIEYIACKDVWFAPASEILEWIHNQRNDNNYISQFNCFKMDAIWLTERIYRKLVMKE